MFYTYLEAHQFCVVEHFRTMISPKKRALFLKYFIFLWLHSKSRLLFNPAVLSAWSYTVGSQWQWITSSLEKAIVVCLVADSAEEGKRTVSQFRVSTGRCSSKPLRLPRTLPVPCTSSRPSRQSRDTAGGRPHKGMQSAVSISANVHCSFSAVCLETFTGQGISCEVGDDKPLVARPGAQGRP